jgi:hypothetical protein
VNVRREGVHILALATKPAPAAAMPSSPLDASKAKGELSYRTSKDRKVFNNLHAAHQSATGADRQIVLWVVLGKLSIVDEVISHSAAVLASFDH